MTRIWHHIEALTYVYPLSPFSPSREVNCSAAIDKKQYDLINGDNVRVAVGGVAWRYRK